jgi:hypothetical protein
LARNHTTGHSLLIKRCNVTSQVYYIDSALECACRGPRYALRRNKLQYIMAAGLQVVLEIPGFGDLQSLPVVHQHCVLRQMTYVTMMALSYHNMSPIIHPKYQRMLDHCCDALQQSRAKRSSTRQLFQITVLQQLSDSIQV